jgi:NitT/TauT family transport system substrate-binding protein
MFKIKKSFSKMIVAALLTLIVLAACSPSKPTPQFKLRIGFFPVQDYLPYFVMQEQGFAKQNGLQLEEKLYPGGAAIIEAMVTNSSVDVGIGGTVPVLIAAERGLIPIKMVPVAANAFADPDHPHVAVLVAPSIHNWKDLRGQLIAVNAINSITSAALQIHLKQEGISNYKFVEIHFSNMGLAVAGGNAAAATMVEPYLTQSLLRGDGKLLGWIIGGPPFERMQSTQIIFSADFYQSNRQAVKAFLRAHLEAVKWINQKPEGARSILAKRLNLNKEVSQKIKLLHWPLDARNNPALLGSMQPLLVDIGVVKASIPANKLYDETLLEEVLKEQK